jgi:hypothetical protein
MLRIKEKSVKNRGLTVSTLREPGGTYFKLSCGADTDFRLQNEILLKANKKSKNEGTQQRPAKINQHDPDRKSPSIALTMWCASVPKTAYACRSGLHVV